MTDNHFADISSNNHSFNAQQYAAAGHLAIAIKATEHTNYINPSYTHWVSDAHSHKLAVFHYHFARPEYGAPDAQANFFWKVVKDHFRRPGDYLIVDVETGHPATGRTFAVEFDKHLRAISKTHPKLYTFEAYLNEGHVKISSNEVWLAAWGKNRPGGNTWHYAGQKLWAWQFTDGNNGPQPHTFAGISGACDGSQLNPETTAAIKKQLHR